MIVVVVFPIRTFPSPVISMASELDGPTSKRNVLVSAEAIRARLPPLFANTMFGPETVESCTKVIWSEVAARISKAVLGESVPIPTWPDESMRMASISALPVVCPTSKIRLAAPAFVLPRFCLSANILAFATSAAPEYVEPNTIAAPVPAAELSLIIAKLVRGSVPAEKL